MKLLVFSLKTQPPSGKRCSIDFSASSPARAAAPPMIVSEWTPRSLRYPATRQVEKSVLAEAIAGATKSLFLLSSLT